MTEHEADALNLFRKFYSKITGIAITSLSVLEPYNSRDFNVITAKQCAIMACDVIIEVIDNGRIYADDYDLSLWDGISSHWDLVKAELEKI
jgi:hypothetical protein